MLKAYIGEIKKGLPLAEVIRPNFGIGKTGGRWTERYVELRDPVLEIVEQPEQADFLLVPHNYNLIKRDVEYLAQFEFLAIGHEKKVVIFFPGDSSETVMVKNSIIFRNSQYRSDLKSNEIILPGYVEDLGSGIDLFPRKKGDRPIIGFCGWAGFRTGFESLKFWIKTLPLFVASIFDEKAILHIKGVWWRKKILARLRQSEEIITKFIIRRTYSGNEKTIELDLEQAKREYVENILQSDFTLCVKGDGNFSTRFYETLSLGRIPLLLDTECVLPMEAEIDYSEFVFKIDHKDYRNISSVVSKFFRELSEERYMAMQTRAREVFISHLRLDAYFNRIFQSKDFLL
ncbi:MAG: exostosin family protein [Candidatus Paceibacterota bacterium]|jgi:hypothetical protein